MTAAYLFILTAIPVSAFLAAALVPLAPFGIDGWRIVVAIGASSGIYRAADPARPAGISALAGGSRPLR